MLTPPLKQEISGLSILFLCLLKREKGGWPVYFSLISFEDCHNPWMLQDETAMKVPGLLVLAHVVTA
jgi:hypothetical protein